MSGFVIVVVCTDRGQHRERRLYDMYEVDGCHLWLIAPRHKYKLRRGFEPSLQAWVGGAKRILNCPSCKRSIQLTEANARKLYDALTDRNVSRVDISALPF